MLAERGSANRLICGDNLDTTMAPVSEPIGNGELHGDLASSRAQLVDAMAGPTQSESRSVFLGNVGGEVSNNDIEQVVFDRTGVRPKAIYDKKESLKVMMDCS